MSKNGKFTSKIKEEKNNEIIKETNRELRENKKLARNHDEKLFDYPPPKFSNVNF